MRDIDDYCHFFVISENSVVLCDPAGIHLYHIPKLESERDKPTLSLVWTSGQLWYEDWCQGSLCDAGSLNPTLYVHCPSAMEIVEFSLDESGRFFVITADDMEDRLARCGGRWGKVTECDVRLRGRKLLSYEA